MDDAVDAAALVPVVLAALDLLPFGFVICEGRNRPVLANARAREMLAADQVLWRRLMSEAVQQHGVSFSLRGGHPGAVVVVVVQSPSGALGGGECVDPELPAAYFMFEPGRPVPVSLELMRAVYKLTKAEARVAGMLLNGVGIDEAAQTLSVSDNTIRAQLKRIFAKTGTRTQSQLVRLLIRSGVLLAFGPDSNLFTPEGLGIVRQPK